MLSEEHANRVTANVVARGQQKEHQNTNRSIVVRQRQHQEARQERNVGNDENGGGDVPHVTVYASPDAPQHR